MRQRGYRGWTAATTCALTLSLVFLVVEKHLRVPAARVIAKPSSVNLAISTAPEANQAKPSSGILLSLDPALVPPTRDEPTAEIVVLDRTENQVSTKTAEMIQQPPEPAPNVTLFAPIEDYEIGSLPLHTAEKSISYLMEAMDKAFDRPTRIVSAHRKAESVPSFSIGSQLNSEVPAPITSQEKLPAPQALLNQLAELESTVIASTDAQGSRFVSKKVNLPASEAQLVSMWASRAQSRVQAIVYDVGLENSLYPAEAEALSQLARQAVEIGGALTNYEIASRMLRLGYSIDRRLAVWNSIRESLDATSIGLSQARDASASRVPLQESLAAVEALLGNNPDSEAWRSFLMLDALSEWAQTAEWSAQTPLISQAVKRLNWPGMHPKQRAFLSQSAFRELARNLVAWGQAPVDYREFVDQIEQIELDPTSRDAPALARAIQSLRLSGSNEKLVATATNNHYRNANLRLSIRGELIEKFLPSTQVELRPVRQRILGADTRGNSAVQTDLQLGLIPDGSAWNIRIGVLGDMLSATRSSKGPAVFHNTSEAQINSQRFIRLNQNGYQVSAQPTNVQSRDYLRKMSTDYDALPVIGDFIRIIAREQFDQKRGIAKRITQRIIAQEADAELDRRLQEALSQASDKLENFIVGPLRQLNLNPLVASMATTDERLTVRYRVANESQLGAHTPRPRAPGDSLMSMQIHESGINNAIAQLGLSGKTWNITELYAHLGEVLQQSKWSLPKDVPNDIHIRFADTRPATVEMHEGRLRLTLRIAELSQESSKLNIQRFLVHSNYIPVADTLNAELVRDGVVEIVSQRNRLALRVIFAKVFVSRPRIALISEQWQNDERAKNLAVSQLEINDGWLAVAIGEQGSGLAAEVAARAARLLK
ncbi:MAG: hypothetical protein AB8B50_11980 [Pirellulaceae bacterium]